MRLQFLPGRTKTTGSRGRHLLIGYALVLSACSPTSGSSTQATRPSPSPADSSPQPDASPRAEASPPVPVRQVNEQPWTPFASVGGITLTHPSDRVERVAFHESNHDGARQLAAVPSTTSPMTMETRDRGTGSRTAADIVTDPARPIRAVVTGTVKRAGSYVLYCDYTDYFLVIAPDANPAWEVKMLHMTGLEVGRGDRVVAGQTVVSPGPRPLAFESQVDEHTSGQGPWPHIHVEVVDPSIPDRPSPGGGCD